MSAQVEDRSTQRVTGIEQVVPLCPSSAADYVLDRVRSAIINGSFKDGETLSQSAVAGRFGVSRAPVREAFRQLAAEGLIETRAHHVAVVRSFSIERLRELMHHRAMLEGDLSARAAMRASTATLDRLHGLIADMATIIDRDRWLDVDSMFHDTFLGAAGDSTGLELVSLLRMRAERFTRTWGERGTVFCPDEAAAEHAEILSQLSRRDAAAARMAAIQHIQRCGARLIAHGTETLAAHENASAGA